MNKKLRKLLQLVCLKFVEDCMENTETNKNEIYFNNWLDRFGEDYVKSLISNLGIKENDYTVEIEKFDKKLVNNILLEANEIIFNRSQEKTREYGDFTESMTKASGILSLIINKDITAEDMCYAMVALKLSRLSNKYKHDSNLDAIGYLAGLSQIIEKKQSNV